MATSKPSNVDFTTEKPRRPRPPTPISLLVFVAFLLATGAGGALWVAVQVHQVYSQGDPRSVVYTGDAARERIFGAAGMRITEPNGRAFLDSVTNFYIFDGGSFNGMIEYWSFDCASEDACWAAIASLGGPNKAEFKQWEQSKFSVVMNGPEFYDARLRTALWNIRTIKNGMSYEKVEGANRKLTFYAVDLDTLRVYHHYESGGFPDDEYHAPN